MKLEKYFAGPELNLLRDLRRRNKAIFGKAFLLQLLVGATEGISVALLLPIITLLSQQQSQIQLNADTPILGQLPLPELTLSLPHILSAFFIIVTVRIILVHASSIASVDLVQSFIADFRARLFARMANARWSYLSSLRSADIYHKLTADIDRIQACVSLLMEAMKSAILVGVYLVVSFAISWKITLVAGCVGAALLIALHPLRKRATGHGERFAQIRESQSRAISGFLDSLKVSKAFSAERIFVDGLSSSMREMRAITLNFQQLASRINVLIQIVSALALVIIVYAALAVFKLSVPELFGIVVVYFRFSPRVLQLQSLVQSLKANISTLNIAYEFLNEVERHPDPVGDSEVSSRPAVTGVEFQQVCFSYGDGDQILHNVDLKIPANKMTVVSGPSGAGKSTIIDLLMGLLSPSSGEILVGGAPLDPKTLAQWRRGIGYVPQETFLLHASVRDNLLLGQQDANDQNINDALRRVCATEFVERLPDGLDTIIGDKGHFLSGGERQRLAMARALLRAPTILVLDEATNALDTHTEKQIINVLQELRGDMTIVAISHGAALMNVADQVVELNNGRVSGLRHPRRLG